MTTLHDNMVQALDKHGILFHDFNQRHPSTQHMLKVLAPNVNLPNNLYEISDKFFVLGLQLLQKCSDGPELTAGLRKLLEAKDCIIRAYLDVDPVDYRNR